MYILVRKFSDSYYICFRNRENEVTGRKIQRIASKKVYDDGMSKVFLKKKLKL